MLTRAMPLQTSIPLTKADPDKKLVDLTFDMEKGEIVYFERINIAGNTKTRDKVVRRELRVDEGELYTATGMKSSQTATHEHRLL